MQRVYACLTTQHDWRLVLLAVAICFLTSIAAFNLFGRARSTTGTTRLLWLVTTGAATGYGVWATHFIAMLAYDFGMPVGFDLSLTVLSLLAAAGITGAGFAVASHSNKVWAAPAGGAAFGLGVAVMHYTGMSALEVPAQIIWSIDLVIASVVVGVVLGIAALVMGERDNGLGSVFVSALLLTAAIAAHHFTAMGAVAIVPDPTIAIAALSLSPLALAATLASAATAVVGISLVAAIAGRSRQQLADSAQAQIASREDHLQAALTNMNQGLCMFDAEQRVILTNQRYLDMYGLSADKVKAGISLRDLMQCRLDKGAFPTGSSLDVYIGDLLDSLRRGAPWTKIHELPDGRFVAVHNRAMPGGGWVATHEDITDRRRAEARISHLALHDVLTNLPNRALLRERLEQSVTGMREGGRGLAVLMLDLDRFKEVNDTLGHAAGDLLLVAVAQRLQSCVRNSDTVGRLGGDEFCIIQRVTDPVNETVALAKRIAEVIAAPFDLGEHQVSIGTSIGIAVAPSDGSEPDALMKNADLALYLAKKEMRGGYRFFEPQMDRRMQARRGLERDLRKALVNGEFALHYQPLISVETNDISGFEALIRWAHPERGNIPPGDFISLAEETGQIVGIGAWVLRQACTDAATWPSHLTVAVNVSAAQFKLGNLVDVVVRTLAATGLKPQRLELEITESVMFQDHDSAFSALTRLHDLGVRIALDDFGTGYSSLSNLRKFPFDRIKIDRSFVSDLSTTNIDALAVVRSIAQLGVSLGMSTTAEGVETQEQADHARAEGCTDMQGFLFSRAVPADQVAQLLLRTHQASAA